MFTGKQKSRLGITSSVVVVASTVSTSIKGRQKKRVLIKKSLENLIPLVYRDFMLMNMETATSVTYTSAHTHELGPGELKHLPLPQSTKQEVAMKISLGVPTERILDGNKTL